MVCARGPSRGGPNYAFTPQFVGNHAITSLTTITPSRHNFLSITSSRPIDLHNHEITLCFFFSMTPSRSISQSSDHADIFYHAITTHFLNLAFTPVFFLITSSCPKNSHLHIILTGGPVDVSIFLISIMLQYGGGDVVPSAEK